MDVYIEDVYCEDVYCAYIKTGVCFGSLCRRTHLHSVAVDAVDGHLMQRCVDVCIYMDIRIHVYMHVYVYMYTHTDIYISTYIYVYI